ncbi:hypothetical protein [Nonomuraea longicatena]|uniref:Prenyltransferase n=1 Tax=Nonomuraea longicatena TaxID=83682 RepID=A0ABN1QDK0_9ACTN
MDILRDASTYLLHHGRLLDRLRFAALFGDGAREPVLAALHAYQNADGGFGNALEPDLRGAASQPVAVETALHVLDDLDAFADPMVEDACDFLASVTAPGGGLPFVLSSVLDAPSAPWWREGPFTAGGLNPTSSLAGLLHKHGVAHPWLDTATRFCWSAIGELSGDVSPYDARAVIAFLERVPDRERAEAEFTRLRDGLLSGVSLDLDAGEGTHSPLDFAPAPSPLPLFGRDVLDRHLDALLAERKDGGWAPNWPIWTPAAAHEWGGYLTVERLKTLRAYGRV